MCEARPTTKMQSINTFPYACASECVVDETTVTVRLSLSLVSKTWTLNYRIDAESRQCNGSGERPDNDCKS